jgi:dTMP kinase
VPLIVFEGPEGVGKTTQVAKLAERLSAAGKTVVTLREPGGTPLGDEVRRLLLDPKSEVSPNAEALLFMASRAQLVQKKIRPALAEGAFVILDRFFLSTYAYQIAGRGLPEADVVAANRIAVGDLRVDLHVFLVLPPAEAEFRVGNRGAKDRMERLSADFHGRVAKAFSDFMTAEAMQRFPEISAYIGVQAGGTVDEVANTVFNNLINNMPELRA